MSEYTGKARMGHIKLLDDSRIYRATFYESGMNVHVFMYPCWYQFKPNEVQEVRNCHICEQWTPNCCDPCGKPACRDCASTSMAYGIETYACLDCRRSKEDSE